MLNTYFKNTLLANKELWEILLGEKIEIVFFNTIMSTLKWESIASIKIGENDFIDFGVRISEIENYEDKENIFELGCKVHSDIFKEYKEEYRNNIDIAFEAIKKSMHNYNYAGEDVKNNKEVLDYIKKKEEELFKI